MAVMCMHFAMELNVFFFLFFASLAFKDVRADSSVVRYLLIRHVQIQLQRNKAYLCNLHPDVWSHFLDEQLNDC